jgi:hypothetical protein
VRVLAPLLALLLPALFGCQEALSAQVSDLPGRVTTNIASPAAVPFGPGERLDYDVRLGALGRRGQGYMAVVGLDTIRGRTTYHVSMAYDGGLLFARVSDHYQSWFGVSDLVSLRFIQDIDQLNYERYRHFEFYPEERRYERRDVIDSGDIPTTLPLDEVSFFYFVRTLPLEVGAEYTFDRYFRASGNPVVVRVLRKETIQVPAGTFRTIVVRPIIRTSGLFGQGGEAELYFSDDERRLLVLMTSKVPLIGSLSLHLRSIREGRPLRPLNAGDTVLDPGQGRSRAPTP